MFFSSTQSTFFEALIPCHRWCGLKRCHTHVRSQYSMCNTLRLCVCVCAYGWLHRCSVDVLRELSAWLRVRRSSPGQACDCSRLVLYLCVFTCALTAQQEQCCCLFRSNSHITLLWLLYLYTPALCMLSNKIKNRQEVHCCMNVTLNPVMIQCIINIHTCLKKPLNKPSSA